MTFADFTLCTGLVKPVVDLFQAALDFLYTPLSFLGFSAPPVHTWIDWLGLTNITSCLS